MRPRVIPCLLLRGRGLVKTTKFRNPSYVGDPVVAVKIFNEKEVDELIILDIEASREKRGPAFEVLAELTTECFMPLCYGGGISALEQAEKLFKMGVEKVALNSALLTNPKLITQISDQFGAQAVVVAIDVKKNLFGNYHCHFLSGTESSKWTPVELAKKAEDLGAGEIMLTSIDRDGTMLGYDETLISEVTKAVGIPVVAAGGAGKLSDFKTAIHSGASAAAAGAFFVYHGKHRAVLISYPDPASLDREFGSGN